MRLGGRVFEKWSDPDGWAHAVKRLGYSAAYCPVDEKADDAMCRAFSDAARRDGIVISEVGAWSNPIATDETERKKAVALNVARLALAERIGAVCCVNIAGSRAPKWDGPHPDNLCDATFDMIVTTVRGIIDAVKPRRTWYTLETMPWVYPDSAENYLRLVKAVDRSAFAVHLDPVNLINSPERAYRTADVIRRCFSLLGPWIKSCHGKDIVLRETLTVHLNEARPGTGVLDYRVFLHELDRLPPDTPLMLEHLPDEQEYKAAADYIRGVAAEEGVVIR